MKVIKQLSDQEIIDQVCQAGTLSEFLRRYNIHTKHTGARAYIGEVFSRNNEVVPNIKSHRTYSVEDVEKAFSEAECWSDVYRSLGVTICDHNKKGILNFANHFGITPPVFSEEQKKNAYRRGNKGTWLPENIFIEDSKVSRSSLRRLFVRHVAGVEYKCSECDVPPVWNGMELTLELDHINGIHTDNRKQNLRWLCPNCHSQTHTFKGKNR